MAVTQDGQGDQAWQGLLQLLRASRSRGVRPRRVFQESGQCSGLAFVCVDVWARVADFPKPDGSACQRVHGAVAGVQGEMAVVTGAWTSHVWGRLSSERKELKRKAGVVSGVPTGPEPASFALAEDALGVAGRLQILVAAQRPWDSWLRRTHSPHRRTNPDAKRVIVVFLFVAKQ